MSPDSASAPEIVIYSTAICPYCVAAKNFLRGQGREWTERRIDQDPALRDEMLQRARRTSVPQIFVGDTHVGGYDDMVALHRAGRLQPLPVDIGRRVVLVAVAALERTPSQRRRRRRQRLRHRGGRHEKQTAHRHDHSPSHRAPDHRRELHRAPGKRVTRIG